MPSLARYYVLVGTYGIIPHPGVSFFLILLATISRTYFINSLLYYPTRDFSMLIFSKPYNLPRRTRFRFTSPYLIGPSGPNPADSSACTSRSCRSSNFIIPCLSTIVIDWMFCTIALGGSGSGYTIFTYSIS